MSELIERIDRWLRPAIPERRFRLVRALVSAFALVYVLARFRYFANLTALDPGSFAPVGVARPLSSPISPWLTWLAAIATAALGVAFTTGRRVAWTGPLFALGFLWITTYRSSWGKILHTENLVALHLIVVAIGARDENVAPFDARRAGWTLQTMNIVTVATYLVAGITKLRAGGSAWLTGRALGDWLAYDALRKIELGSYSSPIAGWMSAHPSLLAVLAIFTLVVELGAPLALVSRRTRMAWALLAWTFHAGILATMAIAFFYPLSLVPFAALFEIERIPFIAAFENRLRRQPPQRTGSQTRSS